MNEFENIDDIPEPLRTFAREICYMVDSEEAAVTLMKNVAKLPGMQFQKAVYFVHEGEKSKSKIQKAVASYGAKSIGEYPLVCFDNTVFGDASQGALITSKGIYIKNPMSERIFIKFSNVENVELRGIFNDEIYVNGYEIDSALMERKDRESFKNLIEWLTGKFNNPEMNLTRPASMNTRKEYNIDELVTFLDNLQQRNRIFSFDGKIYYLGSGEKSDKKILGAINSYAAIEEDEIPLVCFDNTVFGSATEGCLITTRGIYVHNKMKKSAFFDFSFFIETELRGVFAKDVYINDYEIDTSTLRNDEREGLSALIMRIYEYLTGGVAHQDWIGSEEDEHSKADRSQEEKEQERAEQVFYEDIDACYAALRCTNGASFEEVSKAYKALIKQYHPDNYANAPAEFISLANQETRKINIAYNYIKESFRNGKGR